MSGATLTERVVAATSVSLLAVGIVSAWALHRGVAAKLGVWERSRLGAIAHHAAAMVDAASVEDRGAMVDRLGEELRGFGVALSLASANARAASGGAVAVPVDDGAEAVVVETTEGGAHELGRRLAPLYFSLLGAAFVAALAAVYGSIYWGFSRPLRSVRRQLRRLELGPWQTSAEEGGAAEIVALARQVEKVGNSVAESVTRWVEAERRAGAELARARLRVAARDLEREIQLGTDELLTNGGLSAEAKGRMRRLRAAADGLGTLYTLPLEELLPGAAHPVPIPGEGVGS